MQTTTHQRAPQGGAFGANGEWYEGGKFINTVAANEKRAAKAAQKANRKQEIEPFVWAVDQSTGLAYVSCKQITLDYYRTTLAEVQAWVDAYNAGERWL